MADLVGGTTGSVAASGFNCDVDGWSASVRVGEVTYRTFSSEWLSRKNISFTMEGSFTGTIQYDAANTAPMPTSTGGGINGVAFSGVSLVLTAHTGCTFTGTANITGIDLTRQASDRATGTWNFAFDGQPSMTWDETP